MVNNKLLVAIVVLSILQGHSALPQVKISQISLLGITDIQLKSIL